MTASTVRSLLEKAISHVGSETKLGQVTGFSQNAIWQAKKKGKVSPKMAIAIHRATNGEVPKQALCPDIFYDCSTTKEDA